jgi:hypothetical protein
MTDQEIDKRLAELRQEEQELYLTDEQKEIRQRIKEWEQKHGKKLSELNQEETIEACMDVMCLTRSEAEEYLNAMASSSLL